MMAGLPGPGGAGAAPVGCRGRAMTHTWLLTTALLLVAGSGSMAQPLPGGWASSDVGSPATAGSASFDDAGGTWTLTGGGNDIWGTADQLHFGHRPLEGDGTITARVTSIEETNGHAKAGVMMRGGTSADTACAAVVVTPSHGVRFQWRPAAGSPTEETVAGGTIATPIWLRLTRSGGTFAGSYSYDGSCWMQLGDPQTVGLDGPAQAGLCVSSHDEGQSCASTFSNVAVTLPRWMSRDIGAPGQAGFADFDGSNVVVAGSGSDIFSTSDQFHFASQTMIGDATIVTRIDGMTDTGTFAKSGIMIRADDTPSSGYAFLFANPGQGAGFEYRAADGAEAAAVGNQPTATIPRWLKLVREGDLFRGYHSADGTTWSQIGSGQAIEMNPTVHVGLAVTANNNNARNRSTFSHVALLPGDWSSDEIGAPAFAGSACHDGLNWTITGGGTDIWDASDQFHFVNREHPGDVSMVVRVGSIHNSATFAKAGLMIRNGTRADAGHAFVFVTPGSVGFEGRSKTGGNSTGVGSQDGVTAPRWLKLTRSGNTFTAFHSADGRDWTQLGGTFTAAIGSEARIGLAVAANSETRPNSATFRFLRIGSTESRDPFLAQNGIHLRNNRGSGAVVPLRGTNLGSWMMHEPWFSGMDRSDLPDAISVYDTLTNRFGVTARNKAYATYISHFITTADLDLMRDWGINCVRLSFWWANVYESGGTWRAEAFTHFDWLVDEAWKRGIYTILDYHGVPGGAAPWPSSGDRNGTYFATPAYHQLVGESWQKIAAHFAGHPGVAGYDMLNEPGGAWPDAAGLLSHQAYLYNAIRDGDPDHIIFIGSWGGRGPANYEWLVDPASMGWTNICYKIHLYADGAETHDVAVGEIEEITDYGVGVFEASQQAGWNVPTLVGEFAGGATPGHYSYQRWRYGMAGMSWTNWQWKNATGKTSGAGSDMGNLVPNPDGWFPIPDLQNDPLETILDAYRQQKTNPSSCVENPIARAGLSAPAANDDGYQTAPGTALYMPPAQGVLANDHANSGGSMSAIESNGTAHGELTLWSDGSFSYTPETGFAGVDTFRYRVDDTHSTSSGEATVSIRVSPTLPDAGWSSTDIGPPALTGWSHFDSSAGRWTVCGTGDDVWDTSDQFQFCHTQLAGNHMLSAKVESLTNTHEWAKAGIMMRSSTEADAAYAYLFVTPENGISFECRTAGGIASAAVRQVDGGGPMWLRICRADGRFLAYHSADGSQWTLVASQAIAMADMVSAGMAVTSHDETKRNTARFTGVSLAPITAYNTWRYRFFTDPELNDSSVSAALADANSDGICNLLAYAAGLGPWTPATTANGGRPFPSTAGGRLSICFTRNISAIDLTLTVQAANSPAGPWADLARSTEGGDFEPLAAGVGTEETGSAPVRMVRVSDLDPIGDPERIRRFMRVHVRQ